uniref:Uncharacterized protein n=1 Tax=Romanomermis culicivorax TaxID=13658 RepID=A0A915KLK9_ROMCU
TLPTNFESLALPEDITSSNCDEDIPKYLRSHFSGNEFKKNYAENNSYSRYLAVVTIRKMILMCCYAF